MILFEIVVKVCWVCDLATLSFCSPLKRIGEISRKKIRFRKNTFEMPTNAVYQPTTVSFENSGGSLLAQTTTESRLKTIFRKTWKQALLFATGLMFIALGLVLSVSAFAVYEDVLENEDDMDHDFPKDEKQLDVFFMVLGVFFTIFGFFLLGKGDVQVA
jgi:hypothetical protein